MYQRALQGKEKAWGSEHTSTLDTVHNLGILYKNQGKLVEAEQMYQRALQGYEKAWGPEHTSTLDTVNNLGILYKNQGKLVEAEQMYQRALQGYEKAWGPDHTSTLDTVNNLGLLYADQGKLAEAEQMYQRALQGYEKAWGPDHTSTLDTVNNLGEIYRDQCYERVKKSALQKLRFHSGLTEHSERKSSIIQLVALCLRHKFCRTTLLSLLCKVLLWMNEETLSLLAFSHAVSDAIPQYNRFCGGCHCDIDVGTGCFSCKSCKDVDLCRLCFARYDLDELKSIMATCQDHTFADFSRTVTVEDAEQWLQELARDLTR